MGIVVAMCFDFVLGSRGFQPADIKYAAARALVDIAIELAGFELDWSRHSGTLTPVRRPGEREPTNCATAWTNGSLGRSTSRAAVQLAGLLG